MLNRRAFVALIYLVTALVGLGASSAQVPTDPAPPDAVRWSLADVLRMALANNLDLLSARKDPAVANLQIDAEDSKFDGVIGADLTYSDGSTDSVITNNTTATSLPTTSSADGLVANASWTQLLNFGATYAVIADYNDSNDDFARVDQDANGQFLLIQNQATNAKGVNFHWEMPLLQGFGREVNLAPVILARGNFDISLQDLRLQAIRTTQEVENAYWDLLAAQAGLRVANESLGLANDLLVLNKKKVEVGTLAPIEITQADAGVASREEGVILAETAVYNAEDNLRRLLAIPADDPAWSKPIDPVDRPTYEARAVDLQASLASAMEHRSEIATAEQNLKNSELSERVAKNGTWHALRLAADYRPSTSLNDQDAPATPNSPASSTSADNDSQNWRVALTYGYPVGNRQAKASLAIATLNREKSAIALASTEQTVRVDVRTAVRNVQSGAKRVAAARSNATLQRKTVEAEQKKFDNGMSTSFEVLRIQTDLSNSLFAEINAILDYTKALADLERAKGTLLEARGLQIQ